MNIEQAIKIVKKYDDYSNSEIVAAIHSLVADRIFLSDIEQKIVHDALWTITWTHRFLIGFPHDQVNPGIVADSNKSLFYYDGSSIIVLSILKASEEGRL